MIAVGRDYKLAEEKDLEAGNQFPAFLIKQSMLEPGLGIRRGQSPQAVGFKNLELIFTNSTSKATLQ